MGYLYLFTMCVGADYMGEKLAWWFGITSPKYQYVMDEYNRQRAQVHTLTYLSGAQFTKRLMVYHKIILSLS